MITLFALLTTALLASPVHAGYPPPPGPWTAAAWRPLLDPRGPVFTSSAIQANGGRFWIGKEPSAYCPANVTALDCADYPGGKTVFTGGNETLFLDVAVPGGQQGRFWAEFVCRLQFGAGKGERKSSLSNNVCLP